jgi:hypothetical protein
LLGCATLRSSTDVLPWPPSSVSYDNSFPTTVTSTSTTSMTQDVAQTTFGLLTQFSIHYRLHCSIQRNSLPLANLYRWYPIPMGRWIPS